MMTASTQVRAFTSPVPAEGSKAAAPAKAVTLEPPKTATAGSEQPPHDSVDADVLLHLPNPTTKPTTPLVDKLAIAACMGSGAWLATGIAMHLAAAPTLGAAAVGLATVAASAAGAYAAADLGSGIFHWFIDNYPTAKTPVIGHMAREFQHHHHRTNDLQDLTFWSNCATSGKFLWVPMAAVAALHPPLAIQSAALTFFGGTLLAQGSHRWTHEDNPPAIAKVLQKLHVVQPRENHLTHHKLPWDDYYCIVNGMWNKALSKIDLYRHLEVGVFKLTGKEPHSWRDPGVKAYALGEKTRAQFLADRDTDKKVFVQSVKAEFAEYAATLKSRLAPPAPAEQP